MKSIASLSLQTASLARAIASGEVSAAEVLEARLARIDATDGRVNAFTGRSIARARAEAAAVDQRRARGEALPPLAGVPYAVKNLFDIAGEVTLAADYHFRAAGPMSTSAWWRAHFARPGPVRRRLRRFWG